MANLPVVVTCQSRTEIPQREDRTKDELCIVLFRQRFPGDNGIAIADDAGVGLGSGGLGAR